MLTESEFDKLMSDYRSGTNIKAYLPLSKELRRRKLTEDAYDLCREGLSQDSRSAAGRIQLARLLNDMGRFAEANRELEKAEYQGAGNAVGFLEEKARCQLQLNQLLEAKDTINQLQKIQPLATTTQMLKSELRNAGGLNSREEVSIADFQKRSFIRPEKVIDLIEKTMKPLTKLSVVDFFDTHSSKFLLREKDLLLEQAIELHEDVAKSSIELGYGNLKYTMLELLQTQFFIVSRDRYILFAAFDPDANLGKIQHRVFLILDRHLPLSAK